MVRRWVEQSPALHYPSVIKKVDRTSIAFANLRRGPHHAISELTTTFIFLKGTGLLPTCTIRFSFSRCGLMFVTD